MPKNEPSASQEASKTAVREPLLGFREFLKSKAAESGLRDRHRRRGEWVGAIQRLHDQIRDWLRQSDPEEILDIEPYELARTEQDLGTYDAPALRIRLGAAAVDVVPIGRIVPSAARRGASDPLTEYAGRIDVTDGFRKYSLYRELREGEDFWQIRDDKNKLTQLDPDSFLRILQDLLS